MQRKSAITRAQGLLSAGSGIVSGASGGTQDARKDCVFALQISVRFLHKIKRGGRARPPPTHKAPRCGTLPVCGKVIGKQERHSFRWSFRCKMPIVARHFAVLGDVIRKPSKHGQLRFTLDYILLWRFLSKSS